MTGLMLGPRPYLEQNEVVVDLFDSIFVREAIGEFSVPIRVCTVLGVEIDGGTSALYFGSVCTPAAAAASVAIATNMTAFIIPPSKESGCIHNLIAKLRPIGLT